MHLSELVNFLWRSSSALLCCSSVAQLCLFVTPWTTDGRPPCPSPTLEFLIKLMSIESVMPSNHLILCRPLLPPSIFPSIRIFSKESVLHIRWPKHWSFSFSISLSNDYSGLTSLEEVWSPYRPRDSQRVFSNTTVQKHQFFGAQLYHPYITTGKTIALTKLTFVSKVMSLLFNMLSRLVIAFLPRSKHLLTSWL